MIITIQQTNEGIVIRFGALEALTNSMILATSIAQGLADTYFQLEGKRAKIKVLKIPNTPMATKKRTYPAKPVKAVAKKKVVKKAGKK